MRFIRGFGAFFRYSTRFLYNEKGSGRAVKTLSFKAFAQTNGFCFYRKRASNARPYKVFGCGFIRRRLLPPLSRSPSIPEGGKWERSPRLCRKKTTRRVANGKVAHARREANGKVLRSRRKAKGKKTTRRAKLAESRRIVTYRTALSLTREQHA